MSSEIYMYFRYKLNLHVFLTENEGSIQFRDELQKYEKEIKQELEKTNKTRIEAEKRDYESRLNNYKDNLKFKYEELAQKKKDEVK